MYEVDQELGGGELPLSTCLGVENWPARKKKLQIPRGMPGGGGHGYMSNWTRHSGA